jgi:hypothetical protein
VVLCVSLIRLQARRTLAKDDPNRARTIFDSIEPVYYTNDLNPTLYELQVG